MANSFQFEDNTIPTCQLGVEALNLSLNEEQAGLGELRSSTKYRFGTLTDKGYSVDFHRLEEAHGSLASGKSDTDDASLVVLRVTPKTDSAKRRFRNFTVTLTLEPADIYSNADPPFLPAFEPGADGEEYFQEHVTNVTKTGTHQGTFGVKASTADFSYSPSKSTERQFEDRRLLKLTAKSDGDTEGFDTKVKFEITPAVEKNGIGDRLAVALIVKRAPGTMFFIKAVTSAKVSYRLEDTLHWRHGKDHGSALRMGPFGPQKTGVQTNPKGIDITNMMAAADKGLKSLAYLHLPEKGAKKLFLESEASQNATFESSVSASTIAAVATEPNSDTTMPAPIGAATKILPTIVETHREEVKDAAGSVTPPSLEQAETIKAAPPRPKPEHFNIMPQQPRFIQQQLPLSIQNSRAVRHRMMASLYQSLSQLHLEEAKETEALIEMAYADSAVTEGF